MSFFESMAQAIGEDEDEIFATITWGDLLALQTMLGDGHPLMPALIDLNERQRISGLTAALQKTCRGHVMLTLADNTLGPLN